MGTIITLDYSAMKEAYRKANKASEKCASYAGKIDSKINQKVTNLKMGGNSNTYQANYFAKQKIDKLNEKKDQYSTYSTKIENARTFAKDTDANVSTYIKNASKDFRNSNNMKVGVITEFFSWVTTTLINSTAFGRWLNQVCKDVGTWIDGVKRKFKNWYELDGGKYIIKTVVAVLGTVIAVIFLVCVAWPALVAIIGTIGAAGLAGLTGAMIWTLVTAAAAFTTAVIAVADGVTKTFANLSAALTFKDDPGWAKRYNSYSSLSEYLRKNNFHSSFMDKVSGIAANVIDKVTIVAAVINIADLVHNGVNVVKQLKNGGMSKVFNKVHFKSPSGKVTIGTVKYGMKNVIRNMGELKKLVSTTNISRIHTYYEQTTKLHDFYKTLKSGEKIGQFVEKLGDKGVGEIAGDKIKDMIKNNSTSHEYGSKIVDLIEKIKKYHKAQTPSYAV